MPLLQLELAGAEGAAGGSATGEGAPPASATDAGVVAGKCFYLFPNEQLQQNTDQIN